MPRHRPALSRVARCCAVWVAAAGGALCTVPAAATPYLWLDGPGHLWSNPALWSPRGVPGAGDSVQVLAGTIDIPDAREVASLTLSATRLGAGTLTTGSLLFAGGSLGGDGDGSGVLRVTGPTTLAGGASLSLLHRNSLVLDGNTTWTAGNGSVSVKQSSSILIGSGTVFTDLGAAGPTGGHSLMGQFSTGGRITNDGTYLRQGVGSTGLERFANNGRFVLESGQVVTDRYFGSSGSIAVGAGTQFDLWGNASGTIDVAAGGTLRVGSQNVAFPGVLGGTVNNAGRVVTMVPTGGTVASHLQGQLVGGTLELAQGMLSVDSSGSQVQLLLANGGSFIGAGTLSTERLEWRASGGFGVSGQGGSGTTVVTGSAWIDGAVTHQVDVNHDLRLQGASQWTAGNGSMVMDHGGSVIIGAGGVFVDEGTAAPGGSRGWNTGSRGGSAVNQGTYLRRGWGSTDLGWMRNEGLLVVEQGSVTLARQFSNPGELRLAAGTTATFVDTLVSLHGTLSGDGRLQAYHGTSAITSWGTIDPGMPGAFGRLDVDGELRFTDETVLRLGIGSLQAHDLLAVHGLFSANGALAFWGDDDVDLALGDRITLLRFDELAAGSAFDRVSFSGLDRYRFDLEMHEGWLELLVTDVLPAPEPGPNVPEPPVWALLLAALLGTRWGRRRATTQPRSCP